LEAAQLALQVTNATSDRYMPHSTIPMVVHQTWKDTNVDTWSPLLLSSVEKWLEVVVDAGMAYFLWDDDGIGQFIRQLETDWAQLFFALPVSVQQSDVFRIMICQKFGGIYADIDTEPLNSPRNWITPTDLMPWHDPKTGTRYLPGEPVQAIFGIEADCPADSDSHWRMGYVYPIQLTQWALASTSQHPVLAQFLASLRTQLQEISLRHGGSWMSPSAQKELKNYDPVTLTGPAAVTLVVQNWLEKSVGLRWNAVSGLDDGGMSKQVGDVLIFPITGFSPGRGVYGNMGSKPITDPSARLVHHAQGSWKVFNFKQEVGKFCRTFFGLCWDWPKVPTVS
jgi:mannosyltransferase OCH1-like enzyme